MEKYTGFILLRFMLSFSCSVCSLSAQMATVLPEDEYVEKFREACKKGDVRTIVALIREGRSVDERLYGRSTPLHCAVYYKHISAALTLISMGADEQSKTISGLTPFHIASIQKNAQMLEILSKPSCAFNDAADWSKEHLAAFFDDVEALTQLDKNSLEVKTTRGVTPLFAAALAGSESSINFLLGRGTDMAARTECGATIVHAAAASGSVACLKTILSREIDFETEDDERRQPIHYAAAYGSYNTVSHLLTLGSCVNNSTELPTPTLNRWFEYHLQEDGKGYYHVPHKVYSVRRDPDYKSVNLITKLLNKDDPLRGTPMFCALRGGSLPIVKLLIHHGASFNDSYLGLTPLMIVTACGHLHLMKFLVESAKKSVRTSVGGITALHCAAASNSVVCIDYCLDQGCDPEMKDLFGRTPLQFAVLFRAHKSLEHLLAKGVRVTPGKKIWHTNPIVEAIARGDHVAVDMLISRGARMKYKVDPAFGNENILLLLAVKAGSPNCVQRCLESGISTECGDGGNKWKPIHEAARRGDAESMKLLIDAGAKISYRDEDRKTPLYLSIQSGSLDCVKLCIAAGAKLNGPSILRGTPTTLIWATQLTWEEAKDTNTSIEMFRLLLASGASVEARDDRKRTPLLKLVENLVACRDEKCDKYLQIIELLIDAGAYLGAKDKYGTTSFDCVLRRGRSEDLQFFASKSFLFFRPSLTDVVLSGEIVNAALGVFWLLRVKNSSLQNFKVYPQLYILTSLRETSDDLARVILYELTRKNSEKPFIPSYLTQLEKRVLLTSSEAKEAVVDYLIRALKRYCSMLLDRYAQSRHLWEGMRGVPAEYFHLYMPQEQTVLLDPALVGDRFSESIKKGLNDRWALLTERINQQHDTSRMHSQQNSANCVVQ